jgi:ribose 5-phosphate isomerase B
MKIAVGCDHGALSLKNKVVAHLESQGYTVVDFGTHTLDSCDYPDFAEAAARAVADGRCDRGIVMCTTGIGVSISANKIRGIRCALLSDIMSARMTREHNDSNVMALGAAVVGEMLALEIVDTWIGTEFSHGERHQRRVDKIMALEDK